MKNFLLVNYLISGNSSNEYVDYRLYTGEILWPDSICFLSFGFTTKTNSESNQSNQHILIPEYRTGAMITIGPNTLFNVKH